MLRSLTVRGISFLLRENFNRQIFLECYTVQSWFTQQKLKWFHRWKHNVAPGEFIHDKIAVGVSAVFSSLPVRLIGFSLMSRVTYERKNAPCLSTIHNIGFNLHSLSKMCAFPLESVYCVENATLYTVVFSAAAPLCLCITCRIHCY